MPVTAEASSLLPLDAARRRGVRSSTLDGLSRSLPVPGGVSNRSLETGFSPAAADFDGSGVVGFEDFLGFVGQFGRTPDDAGFDPSYDLSANGQVDFADFLIFAGNFGKRV